MKSKRPFDHYKEHICKVWFDEKGYQTATEIVSDLIRCKDCKYSEPWYRDRRRCFLWDETGIDVWDDGFCNYAERKEE